MTAFIGIFSSTEDQTQELYGIHLLSDVKHEITTLKRGTILLHSDVRNIAELTSALYGPEFRRHISYSLPPTNPPISEKYAFKRTLTDPERYSFSILSYEKTHHKRRIE